MEELTIEQKAKAYDEAIKRGLDYIRHTPATEMVTRQDIFETIFPELKESEDERIRKALIEGFKVMKDGSYGECTFSNHNIPVADIIAWLEKRGQTFTKKDVDDAYLKGVCDAKRELEKQGEQKLADTNNKFIRMRETKPNDISEFLDRLTTVEQEFLWEHIAKIRELDKEEQMPANIDYISGIRKELLSIEDNAKNINGLTESQWVAIRAAHRLLGECITEEQKPTEWSEKDEQYLEDTLNLLEGHRSKNTYGDVVEWLKSLKDRVQY